VADTRFITCEDGGRLKVLQYGSGPACLLIHGLGDGAHVWSPVLDRCASEGRVIVVDLRGHGDSDPMADGLYPLSRHVRDVRSVIIGLGLQRYTLVGHSLGGAIVARCASLDPSQVQGLALLDYSPEPGAAGMLRVVEGLRSAPLTFPSLEDYAAQLRSVRPLVRPEIAYALASGALRRRADGGFERKLDPRVARQPPATPEAVAEAWGVLVSLSMRVWLMRGVASALLPRSLAERVVSILPDGRLVSIPAAGHALVGDNPEATGDALAEFLRETALLSASSA
jgi:pimeloyl-ACP methyl ester carboxylesterase